MSPFSRAIQDDFHIAGDAQHPTIYKMPQQYFYRAGVSRVNSGNALFSCSAKEALGSGSDLQYILYLFHIYESPKYLMRKTCCHGRQAPAWHIPLPN